MDHTHYIYTSSSRPHHTWRSEIKIFCSIFVGLFLAVTLITNAQLYAQVITSSIQPLRINTQPIIEQSTQYESIAPIIVAPIIPNDTSDILANQSLVFNTFPSANRIIIPSLGIDVPLIHSSMSKSVDTATKADFDKDLYRGVVQYPSTPDPGQGGNTLIFGHTSSEAWHKNEYATVFAGIPKLKVGDDIHIIRQGQRLVYEMVARSVVSPSKVNDIYMQYTDSEYISLLGCYPLGTDKYRMVLVAKRKS